jgi:hypothetical protein
VSAADVELGPLLTADVIRAAVAEVPDTWLEREPGIGGPDELREAYSARLSARLDARPAWLPELVATTTLGGGRS